MQITINIFISLALLFWPFIFMMSPMMFDAPGADNDKSQVVVILLVLSYPIGISLLLWLFGGNYFGVSGFALFVVCTAVIAVAFFVFGYYSMLSNLARGIANSGYSIADNRAYYEGKRIDGADGDSFSILKGGKYEISSSRYAKDRNKFYFDGVVVEGVDSDNLRKVDIDGDPYWLNSTQVIYDDRILPGANPENFAGFEGSQGWTYSISNEQFSVYINGKLLPTIDRNTFTPLSDFIAKDNAHIFEQDEIILPGADAVSFELLEDHDFGRDNNYIYYLSHSQPFAIDGIDADSFEILDSGYLKDRSHIYITHQYKSIEKLEHIDVASFEVTGYDESTNSEARDRNHYYKDGVIVGDRK